MKLSPLDIRNHEFARVFRGYDPDEVRAFTETVARQWEELQDEVRRAEGRVREIEGKIAHYEKVEEALQEALVTARDGAKRTQEHAEERARLIVQEAELRAERITQDAGQKEHTLRHDVAQLTQRHDEITARLRHFLMSELEILARHEDDRPTGLMKLMPAAPAEALPEAPAPPGPPGTASSDPSESASPEPAPSEAESPPPKSAKTTTYADLYARAAKADAAQTDEAPTAPRQEAPDEDGSEAEEEAEPTWTLRSIIGGEADDVDAPSAREDGPATAPAAEKERIRRILEDLE